jgi:hypothetical protein
MTVNNNNVPGRQEQPQQQVANVLSNVFRFIILSAIIGFMFLGGGGGGGGKNSSGSKPMMKQEIYGDTVPASIPSESRNIVLQNLFPRNCELNMFAFLSNDSHFTYDMNEKPFWSEYRIPFSQDNEQLSTRTFSINLTADSPLEGHLREAYQRLVNNETEYLHLFFTRQGVHYHPNHKNYNRNGVFHLTKQLNRYLKQKKNVKHNLLSKAKVNTELQNGTIITDVNSTEKVDQDYIYLSFYNPELIVAMVDFHDHIPSNAIPPHIQDMIKIHSTSSKFGAYEPIIYVNEFWVIRDRMIILNQTLNQIPLKIELIPTSAVKWQFYIQMQMSLDMQKSFGSLAENEGDELKRILLETNPYLLVITMVVSILHSIFDFLAFKNDISFWKNKENMEGLSVKSIFVNCFFQTFIFLYLLDNETSWLILGSSFVGLLIEFWKLKKAVNFKRKDSFPYITYEDKSSYTESKTKEYDEQAMRYVSYILYPLIVIYAIYSLIYESHKSWYSWILGTVVSFIYLFGFIMMLPQLFINYKLKSVAHLPWKTFMYKALNTFIDDLFSFVIKMPTLHRLACFRDDIVFFIYLYQRWIYKVDYTRVNEFGQCALNRENPAAEAVQSIENTSSSKRANIVSNDENIREDETTSLRQRKIHQAISNSRK